MPKRSHISSSFELLLTHTRLAQGHDGEHSPLLLGRPGVGGLLKRVCLVENQRAIGVDGLRRRGDITVKRASSLEGRGLGLFGTGPV
jgi:hypothetical protein